MAELYTMQLGRLLRRAMAELKAKDSIYDLGRRKWWKGDADLDTSVSFLGRPAATGVGPAAGPQSQMAQNLFLGWLAGARIFELKTVQILDQLEIPRPCIDAHNVGYNVEWSQELKLEESLEEYVAAWVGLHVLREWDPVGRREVVQSDPFVFDMSVGYDLAGITSDRVSRWIEGMRDASTMIEAQRAQLTGELAQWRDIEIPTQISDSITLSTFHGCPPDEIERIGEHILDTLNMDLIVKLNPTLLGYDRVIELVRGDLGYDEIHPIQAEFESDLKWDDALPLIRRLNALAERKGRQFGIKLTNTLVVKNEKTFFSDEKMYLSGQPLHVLAMNLLAALRETDVVGEQMPISFSAGIDRKNFPDAMALGLTPVTTCTDLLRPGGYGRLASYMKNLEGAMRKVGATSIPSFVQKARGHGDKSPAEAARLNTIAYVATLSTDPRYQAVKNRSVPRKVGSHLMLFDCINCDKCIPVCPNNANFSYETEAEDRDYRDLYVFPDGTISTDEEPRHFHVEKRHQLACYTDFCNECGNCDVFCPEDGGPYVEKPLLFGTIATFNRHDSQDGYLLEVDEAGVHRFRGRMRGQEVSLVVVDDNDEAIFSDGVVEIPVSLKEGQLGTARVVAAPPGDGVHLVELERLWALRAIYTGLTAPGALNWATAHVTD
ncbi:MAG: putative selenate reductase [Myxococcota bacterium]|jgi:putative selenate reductase